MLVEPVGGLFEGLWQGIVNIFEPAAQWFNDNVIQPLVQFFTDLWTNISQSASDAWTAVKNVWNVVSTWFNDTIIQPVANFFSELWTNLKNGASSAWNGIKNIWTIVSTWFNNNIVLPVQNFFSGMWTNLKNGAKNAWQGIKEVFGKVKDWFAEKFTAAWTAVKNVFSTGGKIFTGIKDGIVSAFKTVVNAIIKGINKVIATPFNAINKMLNKIRSIEILGISPFKNLWGKNPLSVPQIPLLAQGGVLKRGQMGLLEGSGAEAVVPLERNKGWIRAVANDLLKELQTDSMSVSNRNLSNTNVNNFTQNIYAPQQPSRIELYRQTKNLLALAERGI